MKFKTKGKGKLMADIFENTIFYTILNSLVAYTSAFLIRNGLVEVSQTQIKVTLVDFDNDLSNKYTPIGALIAASDLPNGTTIYHLNDTPLLNEVENTLRYTA